MESTSVAYQHEPIYYNRFYYSNLCHVCKNPHKQLKRCSVCKSIAYCSKDHQIQDWPSHKKLCKCIDRADKSLPPTSNVINFENFKKTRVMKSVLLKKNLDRNLQSFEEQMWMFPRVCAICFSKNVSTDCQDCLNASFCSEEHKNEFTEKQHNKSCGDLKLCMEMDLYDFHHKYKPINMKLKIIGNTIKELPNNLEDLVIMCVENVIACKNIDDKIQFVLKSDYIAPAATILYGLEKSGLLKHRKYPKNCLIIHIVGADRTEINWLWKLIIELLFHWIQNLFSLEYVVIGPDLQYETVVSDNSRELCDCCVKRNLDFSIAFHSKLYHEIVDSLHKPDLVIAFNSGLHEYSSTENDNWKESLSSLTKYPGVPCILTGYTLNEVKKDVAIIRENNTNKVKTILEPEQNPFSNMRPMRDWETENPPVFYLNGYIAILTAKV